MQIAIFVVDKENIPTNFALALLQEGMGGPAKDLPVAFILPPLLFAFLSSKNTVLLRGERSGLARPYVLA